jgi:hypothetical protein
MATAANPAFSLTNSNTDKQNARFGQVILLASAIEEVSLARKCPAEKSKTEITESIKKTLEFFTK